MWIGIVLVVLSVGSCGAGLFTAGSLVVNAARDAKRVDLSTPVEVTLAKDDVGTILGFGTTRSEAEAPVPTVTGPDGKTVSISEFSASGSRNNEVNGRIVVPLGTFTAHRAGTYTTRATGPEGASIAVIKLDPSDIAVRLVGGVGAGAVMLIVGIILIVMSAVRRRRTAPTVAMMPPPPPM